MKINHLFYDSRVNFRNISKRRIIISILLGLFSALIIYSWFYVIRESFRSLAFGFMNFGFQDFQYILSETNRNYYNLFFAGLSVILGNSITLLFAFSRPDSIVSRFNPKRKRLLNDQIFLKFNFIHWFNKIGLSFGVFMMCCMDFDFIPYFKHFSFLLLLVFFLESWKTLSSLVKRNRFKIQLLHLIVLSVLAFCLSRFDVIDYNKLDNLYLVNNPRVDLPTSDSYLPKNYDRYDSNTITFKLALNENYELEIFNEYKQKFTLNDIGDYLNTERSYIREELIPFLRVRVSANHDIDIKYIKMFERELFAANQRNIIYNYKEKGTNNGGGLFKRIHKPVYYSSEFEDIPFPPNFFVDFSRFNVKDTLNITIGNQIKFNENVVSKNEFQNEFKKYLDKKTLVIYNYKPNIKYQDYFSVLFAHNKAIEDYRGSVQIPFHSRQLYRDKQRELRDRYPILILENLIE